MSEQFSPKLGDIYLLSFSGSGSEQAGVRPALVFQNNIGNMYSPNVLVLPLTSCIKKMSLPTHVLIEASKSGLLKDSIVLCENPKEVSKAKLHRYLTTLNDDQIKEVAIGHLLATSAIAYIDQETLISIWNRARELNQ